MGIRNQNKRINLIWADDVDLPKLPIGTSYHINSLPAMPLGLDAFEIQVNHNPEALLLPQPNDIDVRILPGDVTPPWVSHPSTAVALIGKDGGRVSRISGIFEYLKSLDVDKVVIVANSAGGSIGKSHDLAHIALEGITAEDVQNAFSRMSAAMSISYAHDMMLSGIKMPAIGEVIEFHPKQRLTPIVRPGAKQYGQSLLKKRNNKNL